MHLYGRCPTSRLVRAVALLALASCGATREPLAIGPGEYQLQAPIAWYANAVAYAPAMLTRRAVDYCPRGFERLHEWFDVVDGDRVLIWNIRCRV